MMSKKHVLQITKTKKKSSTHKTKTGNHLHKQNIRIMTNKGECARKCIEIRLTMITTDTDTDYDDYNDYNNNNNDDDDDV